MSPILCERFTFAIHLQGTPPRTRTGDQLGWNQSCCQLHQGRMSSTLTIPYRVPTAIPLPEWDSSPHRHQKAEGEGLEPPSGSRRRLFSGQAPHPAGCLPFPHIAAASPLHSELVESGVTVGFRVRIEKAAAAGIEPASGRFRAASLYQHRPTASVIRDTLVAKKLGEKGLNLRFLLQRQAAYH
jgi:hypothetical protein